MKMECSDDMELVRNKEQYWEFIRNLRNDPLIQNGFIIQGQITEEEQALYMAKYSDCYFICLVNGEPAGYVGAVDDDVRIAVSFNYQHRGIGQFMLTEFMKTHPGSKAKVKLGNVPSINLFYNCGFRCVGTDLNFHYFVR